MSDQTPTPRTDAQACECRQYFDQGGFSTAQREKHADGECVDIDFARTLERELAAAQEVFQFCRDELKDIFNATYVDHDEISEKMARDIVRVIKEHTDRALNQINEFGMRPAAQEALLSPWRSMESAPKDGTLVDIWTDKYGRLTNAHWSSSGSAWFQCGEIPFGAAVLAWMPIPDPPKGGA